MAKNCLQTTRREKFALNYYQKLYRLFILTFRYFRDLKFLVFKLSDYLSLFIDKQEEVICDRSPKKCCISCTKLMISMAAVNYDTCPMEGFDSLRVKKILNLPAAAEINMIIGCGIRENLAFMETIPYSL
jgi:nitroreductase